MFIVAQVKSSCEWLSIIASSELGSDLDCSVINSRSELRSDLDCYELMVSSSSLILCFEKLRLAAVRLGNSYVIRLKMA